MIHIYNRYIKIFLALFISLNIFFISACVSDGIVPPPDYPYPELVKRHPPKKRPFFSLVRVRLLNTAPDGPYGFRVGWRDGCDTSSAMFGRNPYRGTINQRKDYIFLQKDSDYGVGYGYGYWFCSRYQEVGNARGDDRYLGFR